MNRLDRVWADPMWRECFRMARGMKMRPIVGYDGGGQTRDFDPFDIGVAFKTVEGEQFGAPWVGAFRVDGSIERPRFVLVSGRCETTIWNGNDRWDEHCHVDVQIAATIEDLIRLAMTTEDRERLGYPAV